MKEGSWHRASHATEARLGCDESGRHEQAGRGRRHRGEGRLGRFFAHGDLRFLILKLIEEKPRHGYELIKAIEEGVAGTYSPSPGVIYPTLTLLEELGWVRVSEGSVGNRKLFEITEEGRHALEANRNTVEAILGRMAEVRACSGKTCHHDHGRGRHRGRGRHLDQEEGPALPAPIEQGLQALREALVIKVGRQGPSPERERAIAAVLGDAARRIAEV